MKFIKNISFALLALLFSITIQAQEKPSDAQIGFDETYYRNAFSKEGFDLKKVNKLVNETRVILRNQHLNNTNKSSTSTKKPNANSSEKMNLPCTNMGFEDGDFSGWCRRVGIFSSYTIGNGYNVFYEPEVICESDAVIIEDLAPYDDVTNTCHGEERFKIVSDTDIDDHGIDLTQIQDNFAVKLGNTCVSRRVDRMEQTITVTSTNSVFDYRFALALQDTGICNSNDHIQLYDDNGDEIIDCDPNNPPSSGTTIGRHEKPYFTVYLETNGQKIDCSQYLIFGDNRIFGFNLQGGVLIKDWTENSLNLLNFVSLGEDVTIVVEVADCAAGAHFGYAYFEASCGSTSNDNVVITADTDACINESINFSAVGGDQEYVWTFYDENGSILDTALGQNVNYTYTEPGYYRVTYGLPNTGTTATCYPSETVFIDIESCGEDDECEDCYSFSPSPGEKYWLAAWVKEDRVEQVISYSIPFIQIVHSDANNQIIGTPTELRPSGDIIEGWQRIIGEFTIPPDAVYFNLNLMNLSQSVSVYFDDVRVHPINGNMKSFVYDPENYRLMAELDENNYTTYYEYDPEGGLVRIKKETTKGVMTIQESRSGTTKKQ